MAVTPGAEEAEQRRPLSPDEHLKAGSRYLRGTIAESLRDPITGAVAPEDAKLLKFHGTYQQDDRDLRNERRRQRLEPAYGFMVRVRAPGGVVRPEQWLTLDRLAQEHGGGTLRLTTRQSFQLHGVLKWNLRETIRRVNETLLTTLAACGDVNRNVMCTPNPHRSEVHRQVHACANALAEHLSPRTTAYHEIWLDGEKVLDSRDAARGDGRARTNGAAAAEAGDSEPVYGHSYLPRKFKIGIAVPPSNDVDVFSHDLGLIAIFEGDELRGFDVAVGGGMGMTYGEPATYPNLARVIGYCGAADVIDVCHHVVGIQRDCGDRSNRAHARLKYTIDDRGLDWCAGELARRRGRPLEPARPFSFASSGDRYGWVRGVDGGWHLTLFIENGRIRDWDDHPLMTGVREIARVHRGELRLTPNQNLIVANVAPGARRTIQRLVERYGLSDGGRSSALRRGAMACVALPTCGLAMADAERYLPELLQRIEGLAAEAGLADEEITVRMSGCPNGCSRPYLGEIGLTGRAPGRYNLYVGASFRGDRLNRLYRENIGESDILAALRPLLVRYAAEREPGEHFGDFVVRAGVVRAVESGRDFHGS